MQASNNTRAPYNRVKNPSPMYEDIGPNDVYIPSNLSAPLNTSVPLNTFIPLITSMPLSTVAPLTHVTTSPVINTPVTNPPMNTPSNLQMNVATTNHTSTTTLTNNKNKRSLDDLHDDNLNSEIERTKTFIDHVIGMFIKFSEPFDSKIVITDVTNNKTYDLSSNYELYNVDGKIGTAKHDNTYYSEIIKSLNDNYDRLNNQKTTKCEPIKCIADFDTDIGDNLCCGQPGTLKDTRYVCPVNKPTCGNFKCGSKFGECS
jgi:hypothetical protein